MDLALTMNGLWLLLIFALPLAAPTPASAPEPGALLPLPKRNLPVQTRVVLLGTGTPNAEPHRAGPSTAIVSGDRAYIIDCGPGVVRRASAAFARGVRELAPSRLETAFITHLHSDHSTGYPDLILTPWVLGRRKALGVYGPPGTEAMTRNILAAYAEDIRVRIEGPEHANSASSGVDVHEISPGLIYADEQVKVNAFPVQHGAWKHAYGFRFDAPDRSIVISGDTTPCEELIRQAQGCDILVHEVYCASTFQRQPASWRSYHEQSHTSTIELGELAARARPKLLVLYHQLSWGCSEEEMVQEVKTKFDGEVRFGHDLDVF